MYCFIFSISSKEILLISYSTAQLVEFCHVSSPHTVFHRAFCSSSPAHFRSKFFLNNIIFLMVLKETGCLCKSNPGSLNSAINAAAKVKCGAQFLIPDQFQIRTFQNKAAGIRGNGYRLITV